MMLNRYFSVMLLAVMFSVHARGQVELFGPDQEAVVENSADSAAPQALADNDPLLKQLLEQAGRGNEQLAASIGSLSRLARWKEVEQLLLAIPGKQLDEKTLANIFLSIGPATYLKMKQPNLLNEEAMKSLDALQDAASKYSRSPQRLNEAINNLIAEDEDTKLQAIRVLLSGGASSIEQLVAACCQPQPRLKLNRMLSTLVALGGGGVSGLRQVALYGNAENRIHAINALAMIDLDRHLVDLATAAHAQDSSPEERTLAERLLDHNGFPSRKETLQALTLDFERLLATARQQTRDESLQSIWSIKTTRDGVSPQPTPMYLVRYREVYDAASRLQRFGQLAGEIESLTVLQTIAYQLMADPDWGDEPSQISDMVERFSDLREPQVISGMLHVAMDQEEIPGAVGLVRIVANTEWTDEQQKGFLAGTAGSPSPLARAAVNPNTRLRFEAAVVISKLAASQSYPGISQVHRTLSEMSRLKDLPTAILVETRPDVILKYENLLGRMGLSVKRASTVSQAQRLVDQGGDVRLILAKQQLSDRTAIELIDTVRRTHRGRNLPIAVFGKKPISLGVERWHAPTEFILDPVTETSVGELLKRSDQRSLLPLLSATDRTHLREESESLLR